MKGETTTIAVALRTSRSFFTRRSVCLMAMTLVVLGLAATPARAKDNHDLVFLGVAESVEKDVFVLKTLGVKRGVPKGATIFVASVAARYDGDISALKCSDSAQHEYHTDAVVSDRPPDGRHPSNYVMALCSTQAPAGLEQGANITVEWLDGRVFSPRLVAFATTGLTPWRLDRTAAQTGRSHSPSSGATALTTEGNELLIAGRT